MSLIFNSAIIPLVLQMRVVSFILASVANECLSITCKHITCTLRMQFESRRSV